MSLKFKQDLINEILNNQIFFGPEGSFAAIEFNQEPVIMTNPGMWDSGYSDDYPDGIVPLNDLDFQTLEYIAKHKAWPMEEPKIYM